MIIVTIVGKGGIFYFDRTIFCVNNGERGLVTMLLLPFLVTSVAARAKKKQRKLSSIFVSPKV